MTEEHFELHIWTDGAAFLSPGKRRGPGGAAFVIQDRDGNTVYEEAIFLSNTSSAYSEMRAFMEAARASLTFGRDRVQVHTDFREAQMVFSGSRRAGGKWQRNMWKEMRRLQGMFDCLSFVKVSTKSVAIKRAHRLARGAVKSRGVIGSAVSLRCTPAPAAC